MSRGCLTFVALVACTAIAGFGAPQATAERGSSMSAVGATIHHGDVSSDEDARRPDERTPVAGFLQSEQECTSSGDPAANVLLDCDSLLPNNEPQIAVDPTNPDHMVASSNDYDSCCDGYYTTFDGGQRWAQGNMSAEAGATGSDPVTSFDRKHATVIHASLNYLTGSADPADDFSDVVASVSTDGGLSWADPVVVQHDATSVPDSQGPGDLQRQGVDRYRQQSGLTALWPVVRHVVPVPPDSPSRQPGRVHLSELADLGVAQRRRRLHLDHAPGDLRAQRGLLYLPDDRTGWPLRRGSRLGADGGPGWQRVRRVHE